MDAFDPDEGQHRAAATALVPPPADFVPFARDAIEQALADRFEAQVRKHAARPAVVAPSGTFTYAQLNARANGVTAGLGLASPRRDLPAAVLVGHGPQQVAAILGVLKAGRPYVGLDPAHAAEDHRRTLAHCGADVLLCERATSLLARQLAVAAGARLVDIGAATCAPHEANPAHARAADDPAYLYYTSGTTGTPKGVLDNQRNVLHNVMRYTNNLAIAPSDRLSLLQSVAFSGAVSSLFAALLNGATSLPVDVRAEGIAGAAQWLDMHGMTIYHSVPSIFERIVDTGCRFERLRVVRLEGDLATPRHVQLFQRRFGPGVALVNGLGATETGISHQFMCRHDTVLAGHGVPVGRPCADMRGLVVDDLGAELPRGEVGEVAIRSRYLALGYWRQSELTAARFSGDGIERTYRTGDLGRYTPDGDLELLGRADRTRKLHGLWVDLQAVEAALRAVPGMRDVVALVHEAPPGGVAGDAEADDAGAAGAGAAGDAGAAAAGGVSGLVVYLVPQRGSVRPATERLHEALAAVAGARGTGARLMWLDALPLDANGKVRRGALPAPGRERPLLATSFVAPGTPEERALATIWRDVLGLDEVGLHDDFSALGGQSLQAIDIVARVEARFALRRRGQRLIEASTVAQMAERLGELRDGAS